MDSEFRRLNAENMEVVKKLHERAIRRVVAVAEAPSPICQHCGKPVGKLAEVLDTLGDAGSPGKIRLVHSRD
jgi:hypothetical protein